MENDKIKGFTSVTATVIENELEKDLKYTIEREIVNKIAEKYPKYKTEELDIQYTLNITINKKGE